MKRKNAISTDRVVFTGALCDVCVCGKTSWRIPWAEGIWNTSNTHYKCSTFASIATHSSRPLPYVLQSPFIPHTRGGFFRHRSLSTHMENQFANFIIVACRWHIAHREGTAQEDDEERRKKITIYIYIATVLFCLWYTILIRRINNKTETKKQK